MDLIKDYQKVSDQLSKQNKKKEELKIVNPMIKMKKMDI